MKLIGPWVIGIGVLVSVGPLAVEQGYAGDNEAKCTLATLNGQYLFAGPATLFAPAFGLTGTETAVAASPDFSKGACFGGAGALGGALSG
jgi:hypothetical protein